MTALLLGKQYQKEFFKLVHLGNLITLTILSSLTFYLKYIQSTLIISNSKGLTEAFRDIRTSTYQSWESEENNKLNNHI